MTYILRDERPFKDDMIDGLAAAYGRWLRRVPGVAAVASVSAPQPGRVSTILGGGSGHYPAFAGLVGPGLADAAVCGDIFCSPSAEQAYRTIRAVDGGAGTVMLFGNYAGDVMHFGLAAARAAEDGIDARIVLVTDDIVSAPPDRAGERRGIAGGFYVFRAAAAAAARGDSLSEVERLARHANEATRTIGVGFDGCTVPGHAGRLFTVPEGKMELGLGIHGESGIETVDRPDADGLAAMLVDRLLAERPGGDGAGQRARLLVNGLGTVKYEELLALTLQASRRLTRAGVELVEPEVGEFVTSLDMAGCSITLVWTDETLEALFTAPAASPGYVHGTPASGAPRELGDTGVGAVPATVDPGTLDSSGRMARAALEAMQEDLEAIEAELGDLDARAGDGDHGATMVRGIAGAVDAARRAGPDAAAVLSVAGMAFADAAGGAAGALWGAALTATGSRLARGACDGDLLAAGLQDARNAVARLGGAAVGDKTMLDALDPFVSTFAAAVAEGANLAGAWTRAAGDATHAAAATAQLRPRLGRAARQADRSVGVADPGATSFAAAVRAMTSALDGSRGPVAEVIR